MDIGRVEDVDDSCSGLSVDYVFSGDDIISNSFCFIMCFLLISYILLR